MEGAVKRSCLRQEYKTSSKAVSKKAAYPDSFSCGQYHSSRKPTYSIQVGIAGDAPTLTPFVATLLTPFVLSLPQTSSWLKVLTPAYKSAAMAV